MIDATDTSIIMSVLWGVAIALVVSKLLTVCDKLSDYLSSLADRTEAEQYLIMSDPKYNPDVEDDFERADELKEQDLEALRDQNDALEALISRLDIVIAHIQETNDKSQPTDNQADGCKFHTSSDEEVATVIGETNDQKQ